MCHRIEHNENMLGRPSFCCFWLVISVLLTGCVSVAHDPYDAPGTGPSPSESLVDACNPLGHLRCIHLTAKETMGDGLNRQFTRHWWRTSYIGRACVKQYGPITGYTLEALFAIPHYFSIGVGNTLAAAASVFSTGDKAIAGSNPIAAPERTKEKDQQLPARSP